MYCWGDAHTNIPTLVVNPIYSSLKFASLSTNVGDLTFCGLDAAGDAYCWGINSSGQYGNGTTGSFVMEPVPVTMPAGVHFRHISSQRTYLCHNHRSTGSLLLGEKYQWRTRQRYHHQQLDSGCGDDTKYTRVSKLGRRQYLTLLSTYMCHVHPWHILLGHKQQRTIRQWYYNRQQCPRTCPGSQCSE